MDNSDAIQAIRAELEEGVRLAKCKKCGCMRETLDMLAVPLPTIGPDAAHVLARDVEIWAGRMEQERYACLGCEHCYAAVAQNAFAGAFPSAGQVSALRCDFQVSKDDWPPVAGEYFVVDRTAPVAVSTLAGVELAEALAYGKPKGLAIVGKTETENIGIDKVVKNIITNPSIAYLVVAGSDPAGHQSGRTILALLEGGIDSARRVIGSPGKRPVLRNVSADEVQAFRKQVQVIDMIGCDSTEEIISRVAELSQRAEVAYGCSQCGEKPPPISISTVPKVIAAEPGQAVRMDKEGYLVVVPLVEKGVVTVEHYTYDNTLLSIIEGTNARALYTTIIANGWVTELSHAAYLGKELARADLAIKLGFKYVQDSA